MSDNAYDRHSYAGAAQDTTLSSSISDTDLTVTCADLTGWPDGTGGNFVVVFEPGKTAEEKCLASARSGNVLTLVSRGMEGAAASHTATTTTVRHGYSARDANEANYAVHQTVGQVAAKGDLLVGSAANTFTKLGIGTTGQALVVASGTLAYGKPTLAESDITGLVDDLAGKLDTPSTAIAKGSLLAGTGANTADSLAVGTDGTVLTADSTAGAGMSWKAATVGQWTDYTPTITGASGGSLTLGNGTLTGRYIKVGNMVTATVVYTPGGTTNVNGMSGDAQVSLPVTPASSATAVGNVVTTVSSSNGAVPYPYAVLLKAGWTTVRFPRMEAAGSSPFLHIPEGANLSASSGLANPLTFTLTYEAA